MDVVLLTLSCNKKRMVQTHKHSVPPIRKSKDTFPARDRINYTVRAFLGSSWFVRFQCHCQWPTRWIWWRQHTHQSLPAPMGGGILRNLISCVCSWECYAAACMSMNVSTHRYFHDYTHSRAAARKTQQQVYMKQHTKQERVSERESDRQICFAVGLVRATHGLGMV